MAEKVKPGGNAPDPKVIEDAIRRYENVGVEIESKKGSMMASVKALKKDQSDILKATKLRTGCTLKALKGHIKEREFLRKASELRAEMEGGDQDSFDAIRQSLGFMRGAPLFDYVLADADRESDAEPAKKGRKPKNPVTTETASAASDNDVAERTAEELAEADPVIDKPWGERLREQNDAVDRQLRNGGLDGEAAPAVA